MKAPIVPSFTESVGKRGHYVHVFVTVCMYVCMHIYICIHAHAYLHDDRIDRLKPSNDTNLGVT